MKFQLYGFLQMHNNAYQIFIINWADLVEQLSLILETTTKLIIHLSWNSIITCLCVCGLRGTSASETICMYLPYVPFQQRKSYLQEGLQAHKDIESSKAYKK